MPLAELEPIAFVHTVDVERAAAFYTDVLGLELVEESPFAVGGPGRRAGRLVPRPRPQHAVAHPVLSRPGG